MAVAGLIVLLTEVPFLLLASVAVNFTPSAAVSLVLMVNVPADNVLVLFFPYTTLFRSYCALPVLLVMVTTVLLSEVTVLLKASLAVTVTEKGTPAVAVPGPVTT